MCMCGWYQYMPASFITVNSGDHVDPLAIGWCGPPSIAAGM